MRTCGGHSGGPVVNTDGNLVAIHSSATYLKSNFKCDFAYSVLLFPQDKVDPKTCEMSSGGVSLACLSRKLPAQLVEVGSQAVWLQGECAYACLLNQQQLLSVVFVVSNWCTRLITHASN